jgi:flagellar protein FlaG|tara:strand:+ start:180 stop:590 length:411 start_codon:yes stop_codon:yes gene_type:complete
MENINFTKSPTPKLTNSNEKITPQGTLEVKSRKKIGPAEYQAEKLRTQTYENRLEAEKNSEMIREKLKGVSASLNLDMRIQSKNLKFSVDQITKRLLLTVSDKESGKVIKQVPSETILKISHSLETLKGILYDEKY